MAVVQNPIIGRAKGSLANTVFSTWKGQNVIKSKAISPTNPNTAAQQLQRNLFSRAVLFTRMIAQALLYFYSSLNLKMTEFNYSVRNFTKAILLPSGDLDVASFGSNTFISGDSAIGSLSLTATTDGTDLTLDILPNFNGVLTPKLGNIIIIVYIAAIEQFKTIVQPEAPLTHNVNTSVVLSVEDGEILAGLEEGDGVWCGFYDSMLRKMAVMAYTQTTL